MSHTVLPYKVFPLSDGTYSYSAVMNVQIGLPFPNAPRTKRFEAIIDSGASRNLFHADFAKHLGLDLKSGGIERAKGISGSDVTYLHEVKMWIPGGPVAIKAGFKEHLPIAGLLGMSGFFEFFRITFDSNSKACQLERIYRA